MSSDSSSNNTIRTSVFGVVKSFASVISIFFVSQAIAIVVIIGYIAFFVTDGLESSETFIENNSLVVNLVAGAVVAIVMSFLSYKFIQRSKQESSPFKTLMLDKFPNPSQIVDIFLTFGVYFLTTAFVSVVLNYLNAVDVGQSQQLGIDQPGNVLELVIIFVSLVVLPPISEEILFRGYLFSKISKNASYAVSVALTSILFGVAHLEYGNLNWIAAIDTMVFSGFLVYISQKHKSLYSSILLHAIKNGIAFYVLFGRFY